MLEVNSSSNSLRLSPEAVETPLPLHGLLALQKKNCVFQLRFVSAAGKEKDKDKICRVHKMQEQAGSLAGQGSANGSVAG